MKKQVICAILCCSLLAGCGADDTSTAVVVTQPGEGEEYVRLLERTPVSEVEGEPVSPDGRYQVLTTGASEDYVSGVRLPETLRIVNIETDEVLWEDTGYLWQSALWSPDGKYLALAYAGRTWNQILLFETDSWTTWQFELPDGGAIPEYTFLPQEDWGEWVDENTMRLVIGQGGDSGEQNVYRCFVIMEQDGLRGSVLEETSERLEKTYDFTHDGEPDTVELVTVWGEAEPVWYEVQVYEKGQQLWRQDAHWSHMGWTSIFALELDGQDYLLRYNPYMGQGLATYHYQIFSLNEFGEEVLLKENNVAFDVNFGSPVHMDFDPAKIAAFLEEVHGYLDESHLLLSTEGFDVKMNVGGTEFQEDFKFWDEFTPYDQSKTLEENLQAYEDFYRAVQGVE